MIHQKTDFELWPAIDLMDGTTVRLTNGEFDSKTSYGLSLGEIIQPFKTFAAGIHIVDLDGAREGQIKNYQAIKTSLALADSQLPVQLGGGIRTLEAVDNCFQIGINRLIIGTQALEDAQFLEKCAQRWGADKFLISVDIKNNQMMTNGWTKGQNISALEFIEQQIKRGFWQFMVTDIDRDGTLQGASSELYRCLRKAFPRAYLLAAGGVGSLQDLQDVKATGINGAIFGKAFYEGRISAPELNQLNDAR